MSRVSILLLIVLPIVLIIVLSSLNILILIISLTLLFFIGSYVVIIPKGLIELDGPAVAS